MYSLYKTPLRDENIVLSEAKRQLVTALIPIIHKWWYRPDYKDWPDTPPGYIHHMAQSSFENSSSILIELGLAEPLRNYPQCTKVVPKVNIGKKIRFEKVTGTYWIFDFLCVFLDHGYHWFRDTRLPVRRNEVFSTLDADLELAFKALVHCGYAKNVNQGYQWTDKIAPIMLTERHWEKDDVDIDQVNYDRVNNWLNQIEHEGLDKLPRWIYGGYSGHSTGEIMGLTFCILRHWSGKKWLDIALDTPALSFDNAAILAHEILSKHQHGSDLKNHKWVPV